MTSESLRYPKTRNIGFDKVLQEHDRRISLAFSKLGLENKFIGVNQTNMYWDLFG